MGSTQARGKDEAFTVPTASVRFLLHPACNHLVLVTVVLTLLSIRFWCRCCRGYHPARGQSHVTAWLDSMTQAQKLVAGLAGLVILGWLTGFSPLRHGNSPAMDGTVQPMDLADTAVENDYPPLFMQEQVALTSLHGILSFLETVEATEGSLGRLQNQLKTFFALFDISSLAEFVFVTSDEDAEAVKQIVQDVANQYQQVTIPSDLFRFLTHSDCSEELAPSSKAYTGLSSSTKHQLLRLACAQHIKTAYYANLETEIFFTRQSNALSFFKESNCHSYSAVCNSDKTLSYQAANDIYPILERGAEQQALLLGSAALLRLEVAIDWRPAIGVMPQVFSTDVAKQLGSYIQKKFQVKSWQAFLLDQAHPDKLTISSRRALLDVFGAEPVWDAYNVYWLFATRACVFENFHVPGSVLQATAVWSAENFHAWSPCTDTFHQPPKLGVVSLVHPSTNIAPSEIWDRIQPCLTTAS